MMFAINTFPLLAIPFFMLAGELMVRGGIVRLGINIANAVIGRVNGGLPARVTVRCPRSGCRRYPAPLSRTLQHLAPPSCVR